MPKRKCQFSAKLQEEYPFIKLEPNSKNKIMCTVCKSIFTIEHKGRADIEHHIHSDKHKNAIKMGQMASIANFFKKQEPTSEDLQCVAKELVFAYHAVKHDISFNASDCTSKLITKLYDSKFSGGKTKLEALAVGVIGPHIFSEVLDELKIAQFISIIIDASNRKDLKLIPILVRYYNHIYGVQIKLLHFEEVPGETSEIIKNHVLKALKKHRMEIKVVALSADNTNTNFGGVARQGQTNVYRKLEMELNRPILGVGCSAHIVHNAVQTAADTLPVDLELIAVKCFKFFCIYTVRNTALKAICENVEIEYKKMMSHGDTRFLSLQPAIGRILEMYDALKQYFDALNNCPHVIRSYFSDPMNQIYTFFLHGSLTIFQDAILCMEKETISATETAIIYNNLIAKLQTRISAKFIPFSAKQCLLKLKREYPDNANETVFLENTSRFYNKDYLSTWQNNFTQVSKFQWVTIENEIKWEDVDNSIAIVKNHSHATAYDLNEDGLLDEITLANKIINGEKTTENNWQKLSCADKWLRVSEIARTSCVNLKNLQKIVEFVLCIPGTSATVERTFSLMKHLWTPDRGRMRVSVVAELLNIKINTNDNCSSFYDKIKTNKVLLKKALTSEKYEWYSEPAKRRREDEEGSKDAEGPSSH